MMDVNLSTISDSFPISSHVAYNVSLRIFKHVHPVLRTPTRECRVTKNVDMFILFGTGERLNRAKDR